MDTPQEARSLSDYNDIVETVPRNVGTTRKRARGLILAGVETAKHEPASRNVNRHSGKSGQ